MSGGPLFHDPFETAKAFCDRLDELAAALAAAHEENERLRASLDGVLRSRLTGGLSDAMRALRNALDNVTARMAATSDDLGACDDPDKWVFVRLRHGDLDHYVRLFRGMPI